LNPSDTLPLFPLQAVLFPGGLLALKVFEPRYLHLVAHCLREHTPFGVVCLTQGSEVRQPGAEPPRFELLGTVAHITAAEVPHGEPVQLRCRGGQRFRYGYAEAEGEGLWVAHGVRWLPEDPVLPPGEALQPAVDALARVLDALPPAQRASLLDEAPRLDDAGWVAHRWCELLPIPTAARQRLLALDDPLQRLQIVHTFLQQQGLA
jgi:Lon protease-like protein